MCVATTQLDTYLKMHAKKPACAQKIDDVVINAQDVNSAAVCIIFCRRAHVHIWFARTVLMHFGLHEHECLIGVQSGLAYTRIIRMYKPNMSVNTYC